MRLEDLERELRAERPDVDPEFARKLDDWAAAGFPRGGPLDPRSEVAQREHWFPAAFRRARERLAAVPTRRLVAPAGALALMATVLVTVSQVDVGSRDQDDGGDTAVVTEEGGDAGGAAPAADGAGATAPADAAGDARTSDEFNSATPPSAAQADGATEETLAPGAAPAEPSPDSDDNIAAGRDPRLQDRTARLSLGAPADEVQEVANDVVEVTDRHEGIVLDSRVTSDQGGARANFDLEIPFTELDAALADLSELGDVISRTETLEDITQRYVRAERERARILERIQELRIERIEADTHEERVIIKSQIRALEAQADAYEAEGNQVQREARYATVAVDITSNGPDSDDDGWTLGDAADDAGDVLRTLAGVALVTLAILVPLALVGALAFWITSAARRQARERALDT